MEKKVNRENNGINEKGTAKKFKRLKEKIKIIVKEEKKIVAINFVNRRNKVSNRRYRNCNKNVNYLKAQTICWPPVASRLKYNFLQCIP